MDNQINDIVTGTISGIKPYGIFIKFNDTFGFCHISNISKSYITNINSLFSIGQEVKAKIINIDNDKINLSMKEIESETTQIKSDIHQNHLKNNSNINTHDKKQSFNDMLNEFLKQSEDKLRSIDRRNNKHQR